jgi:Signal transduction histidine kinase regulating C4-dicarboxylate transport system
VIRGIRSLVRKEPSVHTLLNLNSVITDTVRLVSSDVLNRESIVTTELDPHLPQVQAALVQIQQVLLNLIINALDAVEQLPPAQRRIIISSRSDKGDVAEVSVRDFGVGLPKDRPEKFSITSFPRNKKEWAWDWLSSDRLSKRTAARSPRRTRPIAVRAWSFACPQRPDKFKKAKQPHEN